MQLLGLHFYDIHQRVHKGTISPRKSLRVKLDDIKLCFKRLLQNPELGRSAQGEL